VVLDSVTFEKSKTWDALKPKSLAERRTQTLQNSAFREEAVSRDLLLHQWLIQNFDSAHELESSFPVFKGQFEQRLTANTTVDKEASRKGNERVIKLSSTSKLKPLAGQSDQLPKST